MATDLREDLLGILKDEWAGFKDQPDLLKYLEEVATLTVQVLTDPGVKDRERALIHLKAEVGALAGIYAARLDRRVVETLQQILGALVKFAFREM